MAKKNTPAVSVIIPLFNAEKFIGECLDSLANQTLQDFEVIVVDDCSTDNSCAVVGNFSATFGDRLKIAKRSKNSGCPGIPRNFALSKARGKYVYFLDADDLLSKTALEELYNVAESFNADVVCTEKYIALKGETAKFESFWTDNSAFVKEPTLETFDIGERVRLFTQERYLWQAWGKLFRRQFLLDHKIKFPEVDTFEDMVFNFMCVVTAKNYVRVPFVSYCYRIRDDSSAHKNRDPIESMLTVIKIVSALDNFMSGKNFFRTNPQYRYTVFDFFLQERLEVIAKKFFVSNSVSPADLFNFLNEKVFSANPQGNIALTSYLFITASILKLFSTQQEEISDDLKRQLAALQK